MFKDLKVGDTVIVSNFYGSRIGYVTRVTKTPVFVAADHFGRNEIKFSIKYGEKVPRTEAYHSTIIKKATPELINEVETESRYKKQRQLFDDSKFTNEQIEVMLKAIKYI